MALPSWVNGDCWENVQHWPQNKETLPNHVFCIDFCFFSVLPGDQPELSKCMMPLLIKYQSKLVGYSQELKRIDECLLI